MEILNPGNILPIYANIQSKMRYRCGCEEFNWAIPVDEGRSLAFQFPVPVGSIAWYIRIMDWDGNEVYELEVGLSYVESTDGEHAFVTYAGDNTIMNSLECGKYYLEIGEGVRGGVTYYTEDFEVMNLTGRKKAYRFDFSHSSDIDGILYQTGYTQTFWLLNAVFDKPEIVEPTSTVTDGDSIEVLAFQSVQRRDVLRFPYLPDYWQGTLHRLKGHRNVSITKMQTDETWSIGGKGIALVSDVQDVCFSVGALSWIGSTQVITSCGENYPI
jgi:hypothetical protein